MLRSLTNGTNIAFRLCMGYFIKINQVSARTAYAVNQRGLRGVARSLTLALSLSIRSGVTLYSGQLASWSRTGLVSAFASVSGW